MYFISFFYYFRELKTAFQPYGYELTAAVAAGKDKVDAGYDVPEISKYLDAIHIMSYDLHGSWETTVSSVKYQGYRILFNTNISNSNLSIYFVYKISVDWNDSILFIFTFVPYYAFICYKKKNIKQRKKMYCLLK